jgi:hypothetical protein
MYTYLGKFIIKYQNIEDLVFVCLVISRCKFLKQKGITITGDTQEMLIQLIIFYHNVADPQFVFHDYMKTMKMSYERHSVADIYMSLLEFCLTHRSEYHNGYMKTNIDALLNRPKELIAFMTTNRVSYKQLILIFFERCKNGATLTYISEKSVPDFEAYIGEWLASKMPI